MCTVTYYTSGNKVIITSNRDEHIARPHALAPAPALHGNKTLFYPKDPKGNGSWFGVTQYGDVFVLLNGAAAKHIAQPPYRISRGMVVIGLMEAPAWQNYWQHTPLEGIEPFTIVCFSRGELFQLRWDGLNKSMLALPPALPHIWSSVTLYTPEVITKRAQWFTAFIRNTDVAVTPESLIRFHSNTGKQDTYNGLVINRSNTMITRSITQVVLEEAQFTLHHHDLVTHQQTALTHTCNETALA